jgi:hypothetical protein
MTKTNDSSDKSIVAKDTLKVSKRPPPRMLNAEEIVAVKIMSSFCTLKQIADYLEMHVDTLNEIKKRQPEVERVYKKARIESLGFAVGKLRELIEMGNPSAIFFYLKTQGGWRETGTPMHDDEQDSGAPPVALVRFVGKPAVNIMKEVKEIKEVGED